MTAVRSTDDYRGSFARAMGEPRIATDATWGLGLTIAINFLGSPKDPLKSADLVVIRGNLTLTR